MNPTTAQSRAGETHQNRSGSAILPTPPQDPFIGAQVVTVPAGIRDPRASIPTQPDDPPCPRSAARHQASRPRRGDAR
jgi:hypothetical protein